MDIKAFAKLALLPDILAAATLLHKHNLIDKTAPEIVKAFVEANPDINQTLAQVRQGES